MRRPFSVREHVRWGDVDPAGIIRYDAYTRFFELAESEMFRSLGVPYREVFRRFQVSLPRRAMHMEYHTPPMLDDALMVEVYVAHVGTTSMRLQFDVYGEPADATGERTLRADGYLVLVCVHVGGMQKRPWPAELLALLEPYRMTAAEAKASGRSPYIPS